MQFTSHTMHNDAVIYASHITQY